MVRISVFRAVAGRATQQKKQQAKTCRNRKHRHVIQTGFVMNRGSL